MAIASRRPDGTHCPVRIPQVGLQGVLALPEGARAVVVFAHGSGSSRRSPRNVRVADALYAEGIGSLLFDLLTEEEARSRENVFDVELLADRLELATRWLGGHAETADLGLGFFGASTGAAAALVAAARPGNPVGAIVSRGGRPDLAGSALARVRAPTLLVVGSRDRVVLERNQEPLAELRCPKELAIVAGATHLFEEPGTLEEVTRLASGWFLRHLTAGERG